MQCHACYAPNPDSATVCSDCKTPLRRGELATPPGLAGGPARSPTRLETRPETPPGRPTDDERLGSVVHHRPAVAGGLPAAVVAPNDPAARRVTVYTPIPAQGVPDPKQPVGARKIVGVLVTYTWSDQGQIFPVLAGRNRIGRDPAQCDIAIPQDDTLSSVNSHILFQKNFVIGDNMSMNGTYVDGEPVETAFAPLRNYARIRTGSTHWIFIAVAPPGPESGIA